MTTFTLTIECDNAAFNDGDRNAEIAHILDDLMCRFIGLSDAANHGTVRDSNGNTVGHWKFKR